MKKIIRAADIIEAVKSKYAGKTIPPTVRKALVESDGNVEKFNSLVLPFLQIEVKEGEEIEIDGINEIIKTKDLEIEDLPERMQSSVRKGKVSENTRKIKSAAFRAYYAYCLQTRRDPYDYNTFLAFESEQGEKGQYVIVRSHVKKHGANVPASKPKVKKKRVALAWQTVDEKTKQDALSLVFAYIETSQSLKRRNAYKVAVMALRDGASVEDIVKNPAKQVIDMPCISKETRAFYFANAGINYLPGKFDPNGKHKAGTYHLINPDYVLVNSVTFLKLWKVVRAKYGKNFPYPSK